MEHDGPGVTAALAGIVIPACEGAIITGRWPVAIGERTDTASPEIVL